MREEFKRRINYLDMLLFFVGVILISRLAYVQLARGTYYVARAERNSTREIVIDAPRGDIVTTDGTVLVTSRPAYVVSLLVPSDETQRERVVVTLAQLLDQYGVTEEKIRTLIKENTWRRYRPIRLAVDVDEEVVLQIDERRMELPGVVVERQAVRDYPQGNMGCYLIGGLGSITENTVEEYRKAGYRLDASVGIFGLEKAYENVDPSLSLRGQDGYRSVEVDSVGRPLADVGETPAVAGNDMTLTIDARLQATAEQALQEIVQKLDDKNRRYPQKPDRAAAVVLNVKSGEVLAWASYPDFDPGQWAKAEYLWNSNIPLNAYPVGSTFKPITALTGLVNGVVSPDEKFYCPGYHQVGATRKTCWNKRGHGQLTLEEGIKVSCNVVFYEIAQRLINQYGRAGAMDKVGEMVKLLQFGQEIPLDFAAGYLRAPGIIPTSENFQQIHGYKPYPGEVWDIAIGQGIVEFTPLQMASYVAMLANGGYQYEPYVVKQITGPDGEVNFQAEPHLITKVNLDSEALSVIRRGMHEVMLPGRRGGPGNGSAYYLFTVDPVMRDNQKVEVAGKTGTAEIGPQTPHSWFISYAPFEDPEIAVAVFVAHGRSGAASSVPVAHSIYKTYFEITSGETVATP